MDSILQKRFLNSPIEGNSGTKIDEKASKEIRLSTTDEYSSGSKDVGPSSSASEQSEKEKLEQNWKKANKDRNELLDKIAQFLRLCELNGNINYSYRRIHELMDIYRKQDQVNLQECQEYKQKLSQDQELSKEERNSKNIKFCLEKIEVTNSYYRGIIHGIDLNYKARYSVSSARVRPTPASAVFEQHRTEQFRLMPR